MSKPTKITDQKKDWEQINKKKTPYLIGSRKVGKPYLIICEGKVTEPIYFEAIAGPNVQVTAKGYGRSKTALVEKAEKHCDDYDIDPTKTRVWVVFDFDVKYDQISNQREDYNEAIVKAKQLGFEVAYSNDCFELWLVLHLKAIEGEFHRKQLFEFLTDHFGEDYEQMGKNRTRWLQKVSEWKSDPRVNTMEAFKRSVALDLEHSNKPFADQNPITKVYQLAQELNPALYPLD